MREVLYEGMVEMVHCTIVHSAIDQEEVSNLDDAVMVVFALYAALEEKNLI